MITRSLLLALLAGTALTLGCQPTESVAAASNNPLAGMSEEEMMQMMTEMATPGTNHEFLAALVGTWNAEASMLMEEAGEPELSTGTMVNEMILGGRFLKGEYSGTAMHQPFNGMALTGFNNGSEQFEGYWIDTFGTLMSAISHGTYDEGNHQLTMRRTMDDEAYGKSEMREVITIESPDRHTFEMFMDQGDGEFRNMKIIYTRK